MELTPKDKSILRSAERHGSYHPTAPADFLRCLRLVEVQLLRDNDNAPGCYTITTMGEQLLEAMTETV